MSKYIVKCLSGKQLLRQILRIQLLVFVFFTCTCIFAAKGDDERWEKAEKKVKEKHYPEAFLDSLRTFYNIGANRGLKNLPDNTLPFTRREKCVYNAGWGFVKAGWGIIEAKIDNDNDIFVVKGKAVTNNFTSAFFKTRDYVYATVDLKGFYPYFFEQHIRENRYRRNNWAFYDHEKGKVFTNRKKKKTEYDSSPFTHNYMSLLYYLRTLDFAPGDTFSINCFVHGKDYPVFFKVLRREKIEVDAGTFKCVKVQPRLVGEGRGFTKKDKMYLWFTDDKYHMLVKGKSKIALGWITIELIHYERE